MISAGYWTAIRFTDRQSAACTPHQPYPQGLRPAEAVFRCDSAAAQPTGWPGGRHDFQARLAGHLL